MSQIEYQIKNVSISKCFNYLSGNTGLTVRTIHNCKSKKSDCLVLSSSLLNDTSLGYIDSNTILPNGKSLKLFRNKEGIVISRNGYAGTMSYLKPDLYTLTDHAYILYKHENCKYDIDLNWFILSYQKYIREKFLTTKQGNQTFVITKFFKEFTFDIPKIEFQKEIAETYKILEKQKLALQDQRNKIKEFVLEKIEGYQMTTKFLFDIFNPHQGNAIYTKKNINKNGWNGDIPVISSNTDNNGILEYIDKKYVKEKDYITKHCLTWSVDGYAGKLFERNFEKNSKGFVPNNHCGVLLPKVETQNLYFPYLILTMQHEFFIKAKNSGNKKLGNNQMTDIKISIPIKDDGEYDLEAQKEIAKKYLFIEEIKTRILNKMDELLNIKIDLNK